jgi:hypothetical protein
LLSKKYFVFSVKNIFNISQHANDDDNQYQ